MPVPTLREPSQRVSPRVRTLWQVEGGLAGLALVTGVLVADHLWTAVDLPRWGYLLAVLSVAGYVAVVPQWRYLVHRWEVTDVAVYTQTGWWVRERRVAPMSRIQTVDYEEGVLGRLFGVASVTVTTASAAGALVVSGLEREPARLLVDELTLRADAVPGDAT